jgi:hypothetical protein
VSDRSTILFETDNLHAMQLWRIADSVTLHAVPVPVPTDAPRLLDTDAGRIVVQTGKSSLAALNSDGTILARIAAPALAGVLPRLDDGNDRIVDLPGQDGRWPQALLTTEGLFVAYARGCDPSPDGSCSCPPRTCREPTSRPALVPRRRTARTAPRNTTAWCRRGARDWRVPYRPCSMPAGVRPCSSR